jgi:hypothetical protein
VSNDLLLSFEIFDAKDKLFLKRGAKKMIAKVGRQKANGKLTNYQPKQ